MSIVSNTRVDIVARGVIKACLELGHDPARRSRSFRIPGAWRRRLQDPRRYGVDTPDRSVSLKRGRPGAVEKIQGARADGAAREHPDRRRTTFIVQGITGREAVNLTRECLDYGAARRSSGGVTPGRLGRDVHGVPVFDTVAQAVDHHGSPIDGSVVTVPPAFTKDAVFEAIENGVGLVVIVTERIPPPTSPRWSSWQRSAGAASSDRTVSGSIVPDVVKMGGIGGPAKERRPGIHPGRSA